MILREREKHRAVASVCTLTGMEPITQVWALPGNPPRTLWLQDNAQQRSPLPGEVVFLNEGTEMTTLGTHLPRREFSQDPLR